MFSHLSDIQDLITKFIQELTVDRSSEYRHDNDIQAESELKLSQDTSSIAGDKSAPLSLNPLTSLPSDERKESAHEIQDALNLSVSELALTPRHTSYPGDPLFACRTDHKTFWHIYGEDAPHYRLERGEHGDMTLYTKDTPPQTIPVAKTSPTAGEPSFSPWALRLYARAADHDLQDYERSPFSLRRHAYTPHLITLSVADAALFLQSLNYLKQVRPQAKPEHQRAEETPALSQLHPLLDALTHLTLVGFDAPILLLFLSEKKSALSTLRCYFREDELRQFIDFLEFQSTPTASMGGTQQDVMSGNPLASVQHLIFEDIRNTSMLTPLFESTVMTSPQAPHITVCVPELSQDKLASVASWACSSEKKLFLLDHQCRNKELDLIRLPKHITLINRYFEHDDLRIRWSEESWTVTCTHPSGQNFVIDANHLGHIYVGIAEGESMLKKYLLTTVYEPSYKPKAISPWRLGWADTSAQGLHLEEDDDRILMNAHSASDLERGLIALHELVKTLPQLDDPYCEQTPWGSSWRNLCKRPVLFHLYLSVMSLEFRNVEAYPLFDRFLINSSSKENFDAILARINTSDHQKNTKPTQHLESKQEKENEYLDFIENLYASEQQEIDVNATKQKGFFKILRKHLIGKEAQTDSIEAVRELANPRSANFDLLNHNAPEYSHSVLSSLEALIFDHALDDSGVATILDAVDFRRLNIKKLVLKDNSASLSSLLQLLAKSHLPIHLESFTLHPMVSQIIQDDCLTSSLREAFGDKDRPRFSKLKSLTLHGKNLIDAFLSLQDSIALPMIDSLHFFPPVDPQIHQEALLRLRQSYLFAFERKELASHWENTFSLPNDFEVYHRLRSRARGLLRRDLIFYTGSDALVLFRLNEIIQIRYSLDILYPAWTLSITSHHHTHTLTITTEFPQDEVFKRDFSSESLLAFFKFLAETNCSSLPFRRLRTFSWTIHSAGSEDLSKIDAFFHTRPLPGLTELTLSAATELTQSILFLSPSDKPDLFSHLHTVILSHLECVVKLFEKDARCGINMLYNAFQMEQMGCYQHTEDTTYQTIYGAS